MFCEMAMMQVLLVLFFLNRVEPFNLNRINHHHYGLKSPIGSPECSFLGVEGRNVRNVLSMTSEPLMEDGVTLNSLKDPFLDGTFLKESIQRWLDEEYIPQDVHSVLGEEVKKVYIAKRLEGNVLTSKPFNK